jgi:Family of unknown function (DUF6477)
MEFNRLFGSATSRSTARYNLWLRNTPTTSAIMTGPNDKAMRDKTMTDFASVLNALRRPKILIRAARAGVSDYRRDRDLKRLLRHARSAAPHQAIGPLLAEERRLEDTRTAGEATYSIQRHVAVLTAIIAEARLIPAAP